MIIDLWCHEAWSPTTVLYLAISVYVSQTENQ
jgi:hypothetical protein